MKKTLTLIAAATLSALSFASWADTLTVGASNTPHAEILEQAKPILAKQGIDLEIKPFQDYILPNTALANQRVKRSELTTEAMETVVKALAG